MKESFILYNSFYEPIKSLKNEQLGKLLRAIFNYTINGEITKEDDFLIAFMFIKNEIDKNNEKWQEEKRKRSEAGKKGMASRWNKSNNNVIDSYNKHNNVINDITNITDNVYVDDNVYVNDNVNDNKEVLVVDIYTFIEKNFGRTLSPVEYQEISTWDDSELTRYAIKQAVLNSVCNIKYISRILENYKIKNIKTVLQAQKDEKKFKEEQKLKKNNYKQNNIQKVSPEWIDKTIQEEKATDEEIKELEERLNRR